MTNSAQAADSLSQIFMGIFGSSRTGIGNRCFQSGLRILRGFGHGEPDLRDFALRSDPDLGTDQCNSGGKSHGRGTGSSRGLLPVGDWDRSAASSWSKTAVIITANPCKTRSRPSDFEAGRMVAMFLAACAVAQTKGAMISLHNGQAIASGVQAVTVNNQNVNGPVAQGDAGGSYNAGFILCYDPSSPPVSEHDRHLQYHVG